jgi:hypothetical protein
MAAEATEFCIMAAPTFTNQNGMIRSLGMTGALLILAGAGGVITALVLTKSIPPPSSGTDCERSFLFDLGCRHIFRFSSRPFEH